MQRDLDLPIVAPHGAGDTLHFKRSRNPLERGCDRVEWLLTRLAALALVVMVGLTTADALGRYFFNAPVDGAPELANEFLMPALVFFVISYVYRLGGHVRVTILSDLLPARVQRVLMVVFDAATALMFAALTWGVLLRMVDSYQMREYSSSPLNYLLAPSFAIVVIGGALMTVRAAASAITARHPAVAIASDAEAY
jgi:TRAP-type C4-dicarboxylate transport system permease small subunit